MVERFWLCLGLGLRDFGLRAWGVRLLRVFEKRNNQMESTIRFGVEGLWF